ncbi:MAG TPA: FapA family protein [Magnetospirillaceae bacterium]|nr:FapA family protein [Magnetospirillaceae bacterium]
MAGTVGLPQIRDLMRRYLEEDRLKTSVAAEGASLEEALRNAAIQLACPVASLDFEIVEKGAVGTLGIGRKSWKVRAYRASARKDVPASAESLFGDMVSSGGPDAEQASKDRDGEIFVRLYQEGALLKVTQPVGRGRRATEKAAMDRLRERNVQDIDVTLVRDVVHLASGQYVPVGRFAQNPALDALINVDITDQDMKAYAILTPPGTGGCDLSAAAIFSFLRNNRIIYGVKEDVLTELEDRPRYREPILVAEGARPQNGQDSYMQFNFLLDKSQIHMKETADGRVDFKELGLIQNVVAGQPLARKIPAESAVPGRTVTGKIIPARNGKDIPMPLGKNVRTADDGVTVLATINGQVTYIGSKINVEEVYTIKGDVNLKTGNVMFLGTVLVLGNVEDGFTVKATGNVEIHGNVAKSEIIAEGNIIVHQGVTGKSGGCVQAGKNVWAKFIENAKVEAGESVIVSDGIVNSDVTANRQIICQGKRATIVGGRFRACEEINTKTLGSPVGGTETVCEVGYDPKSKERMDLLSHQNFQLRHRIEELDKNISTLQTIKKQRKTLPDEKEAVLQQATTRRAEMAAEAADLAKEIESISAYLSGLKVRGKVSVSGKAHPGVRIIIKDVVEELKTEMKGITFYLDNMMIKRTKYEEPDAATVRRGTDANKAH